MNISLILTNKCFTKRAYFPEGLLSREGLLFSIYGIELNFVFSFCKSFNLKKLWFTRFESKDIKDIMFLMNVQAPVRGLCIYRHSFNSDPVQYLTLYKSQVNYIYPYRATLLIYDHFRVSGINFLQLFKAQSI